MFGDAAMTDSRSPVAHPFYARALRYLALPLIAPWLWAIVTFSPHVLAPDHAPLAVFLLVESIAATALALGGWSPILRRGRRWLVCLSYIVLWLLAIVAIIFDVWITYVVSALTFDSSGTFEPQAYAAIGGIIVLTGLLIAAAYWSARYSTTLAFPTARDQA